MNSTPKKRLDLAWRKISDEAVIIELSSDRMFHQLNDAAAFIWELCDGHHSIEQIVQMVTEEFEISTENAQQDVQDFISNLVEMKLLQ